MAHQWTEAELNFIRDNCAIMKDVDIAARLTILTGEAITIYAVRHARQHLGLGKLTGKGVCGLVDPDQHRKNQENA